MTQSTGFDHISLIRGFKTWFAEATTPRRGGRVDFFRLTSWLAGVLYNSVMMTQASAYISGDRLRGTLLELGERQRWRVWLGRVARAVWLWGSVLLMIIIADALWPMGVTARLVLDLLLVLSIPLALLFSRTRELDAHRGPLRHARQLETHHDLRDNPLVNGLFLLPMIRQTFDPLLCALAKRTQVQAQQTIDRIDQDVILDRRNLHRQAGYIAMVSVTWLVTLMVVPSLVGTGLGRLLWPVGDVPPFSFTRITLEADESQPQVGGDVQLTAIIAGQSVDRVDLVELDEDFKEVRRWRMSVHDSRQFERVLRAVREPMVVQAEAAGGARSKRVLIHPQSLEAPAEILNDSQDERMPSDTARDFDGALQSQWPAIHQGLMALRDQAQEMGEMLEALDALEPGSAAWARQLEPIDDAMQQFQANARELAELVRDTMKTALPADQAKLQALAEALENLSMRSLGMCPNPGLGAAEDANCGIGTGSGTGIGADGGMLGPLGSWLGGVQLAQTTDFAWLNDMTQAMGLAPSPFGSAGPQDVDATSLPGPPPPQTGGVYNEVMLLNGGDETLRSQEATMQRVPPVYRPLVQRYFERLADDERDER